MLQESSTAPPIFSVGGALGAEFLVVHSCQALQPLPGRTVKMGIDEPIRNAPLTQILTHP